MAVSFDFTSDNVSSGDRSGEKQRFIRVLALLMVLGMLVLTGCSSGSDDDNSSDDSGGTTTGDGDKSGVYEQNGEDVADYSEEDAVYEATETDESAVYVYNAATYTLTNGTLKKTDGDTSDDDSSNFYGLNAVVLAEGKSTITLEDCTITSSTEGSNGVFAYEEDTIIYVEGGTITTTGNSSRGVDATYGGTIDISGTEISTQGDHCAALATDRYENNDPPTIIADNVTGDTAGDGSPGLYCTGSFTVSNSTLVATGSEAAAIEGLNSITLTSSNITGSKKWGVIIYQSTSGDSSEGMGTFDMTGGSLTNDSSGPVFMVCNTEATIDLTGVTISTLGDVLIRATDSGSGDDNINSDWGSAGGDVTFTATDQTLEGTVSCNDMSSIELTLTGSDSSSGSVLTGAVVIESGGEVVINLEEDSGWDATADSTVTELNGVVFSSGVPTNVDADSGVTITYGTMTDGSGSTVTGTYTLDSGGTLTQ